jgi:hypothetical protein
MAAVVNERDKIMRTAAARIVAAQPADQIIVPGYTGIRLVGDVDTWDDAPTASPYRIQPATGGLARETLSVIFSGITPDTAVTWELGTYLYEWDAAKQDYVIGSFAVAPISYHGIILTTTGVQSVRTIEMTSYPRSSPFPGVNTGLLGGAVRAKVTWGGSDFYGLKAIKQLIHW